MITTKASYVTTAISFLSHWEGLNQPLGLNPIKLSRTVLGWSQPIFHADLEGLKDDLIAARLEVSNMVFALAEAREDFKQARVVVVDQHGQLNGRIRGSLPGTKWERLSTPVVSAEAGADAVTTAATAALNLWNRINAANALDEPLVLRNGVTAVNFAGLRDAVTITALEVPNAEQNLKDAVEKRNDIEDKIYKVLKAYRQMIPQIYADGDAAIDSMPALTPPPGATPSAVTLAGSYNAGTGSADLSWNASTSQDVTHYDVLVMAGDEFDEDNADLAATVQAGQPLVFSTSQYLGTPGSKIVSKVYARTSSGHTAGSNAVVVIRPA